MKSFVHEKIVVVMAKEIAVVIACLLLVTYETDDSIIRYL